MVARYLFRVSYKPLSPVCDKRVQSTPACLKSIHILLLSFPVCLGLSRFLEHPSSLIYALSSFFLLVLHILSSVTRSLIIFFFGGGGGRKSEIKHLLSNSCNTKEEKYSRGYAGRWYIILIILYKPHTLSCKRILTTKYEAYTEKNITYLAMWTKSTLKSHNLLWQKPTLKYKHKQKFHQSYINWKIRNMITYYSFLWPTTSPVITTFTKRPLSAHCTTIHVIKNYWLLSSHF